MKRITARASARYKRYCLARLYYSSKNKKIGNFQNNYKKNFGCYTKK